MGRRRDVLEIYANVLKVCSNGASKTHIVYKANLNFNRLPRYLDFLIKNGLIEVLGEGGKTYYKTSRKGIEFLNEYRKMKNLVANVMR